MRWNKTTLLWIAVAAIVVPLGFTRIRLALQSTEQGVETTVVRLLDALEDRQPRRIRKILTRDFVDEGSGYGRRDVVDASKFVLQPGTRYRATLDEEGGLVFLSVTDDPVRSATVRVRCMIESGSSGGEFRPWWHLEATLDLERHGGIWRVVCSRDVNHDRRPHR